MPSGPVAHVPGELCQTRSLSDIRIAGIDAALNGRAERARRFLNGEHLRQISLDDVFGTLGQRHFDGAQHRLADLAEAVFQFAEGDDVALQNGLTAGIGENGVKRRSSWPAPVPSARL